ncbi:MAG: helix-turn-helix domain-containing protein [Lysobacter sp.]|nr:MAG: helix-turn-helix domain-containing protein [Lysobacter sp.]
MKANPMPDDTVRGIGQRLRQAREDAGMSLAEAGAKLKMQTHVVDALEREDWGKLGAPVFIRGQLRSYAKLLGLPADAIVENVAMPSSRPAELVPQTYTPRMQRVAEQTKLRLVYVVLTAAIAVPVWLATRSQPSADDASVALDVAPGEELPIDAGVAPTSAHAPSPVVAEQRPLVASMTPMPQRPAAVAAPDISVSFAGESWVKLTGPDGAVLEQALIQSGQQRNFAAGQIGKAVLGNATAVSVRVRGQPVDLTPFVRANVVRFTVSSDGALQPVER